MSKIHSAIKSVLRRLLGAIPHAFLQKAEDSIQRQLGKGAGAWSTTEEAKATYNFIHNLGIDPVFAIDAGANLGEWSAELKKLVPHVQIIAFEPSKSAFEQLARRFQNEDKISCFNLALGMTECKAILYADKKGSGLGSLTNRRLDHFNITLDHQEEVSVETLDGFLLNRFPNLIPNILKMDVEGHEFEVLQGASETLKEIRIVQFEFGGSNIDTKTFFQDFWYFFMELGFQIYRLTPSGPKFIGTYSEQDETFRATNYFAIRN